MPAPAAAPYAPTPSLTPLVAAADQAERWIHRPTDLDFNAAAKVILDAAAADGPRRDISTTSLAGWAFGSSDGRAMELAAIPFAGRLVPPPLAFREHAFAQLATRVGAPASYVRELPPKLAMACMNFGLARHDKPALLRLAGNSVRAIVSERYAALDDALVLEVIDETIRHAGLQNDALARVVAVGTTTVVRITIPNEGVAVRRGDIIEHGFEVSNSELGLRSVQVTPITYRLVCSNGMRAWQSAATTRLRHIGDPARLRDAFREAVPLALAEARGDIDRWKRAVDSLVDDAFAEVESLRSFGASTTDVQTIARTLAPTLSGAPVTGAFDELAASLRRPTTVFDFANAITATARDRNTAARLDLEQLGHRYLVSRTR